MIANRGRCTPHPARAKRQTHWHRSRSDPYHHGGEDAMMSQQQAEPDPCARQDGTAVQRILIIDGEPENRSFVARTLMDEGYAADTAGTGAQGLRQALASLYDLVILDLLLPDMDGRIVLDRLLSARPYQAVMMSSRVSDVAAKVDCLERGAQDYMTKPFPLAELLARVHVRLRAQARQHDGDSRDGEAAGPAEPSGTIRAGTVSLDMERLAADAGHGPVRLTRLEFLLLRELAAHPGQPVTKGRLLATVRGY